MQIETTACVVQGLFSRTPYTTNREFLVGTDCSVIRLCGVFEPLYCHGLPKSILPAIPSEDNLPERMSKADRVKGLTYVSCRLYLLEETSQNHLKATILPAYSRT